MKRSTARWTVSLAAAALLALPVGAVAQTGSPTTQPPTTSAQSPSSTQGSAQEHLRQANQALNDIPAASLTGRAKTKVAELKKHLTALEKSASQSAASGTSTSGSSTAGTSKSTSASGKDNWNTHLAAADKVLTDLLGSASSSATEPSAPTGTSGTASGSSKASGAIQIDETTRTKLTEVRTHLTAFAAAMSRTSAASSDAADPAATSAAASSTMTGSSTSSTTTGSSTSSSTGSPTTTGATGTTGSSMTGTAGTSGTTAQPPTSTSASPQSQASVNPEEAKRHITAARDTLSQITQLPAAAQLTGDARTQVSQLISNFNELITTNAEWRASYDKVEANLTALIGAETTDESATPTAGTAGAVGTSGTTAAGALDPAIRAKLVEFRQHLKEFEKAAGGSTVSSDDPSAAAAGTSSTGSTGTTGTTTGTTGTSGTMTGSAGTTSGTSSSTATESADPQQRASAGHSEAMRHIAAIEAILNGSSASGSAAGSSTTGTSSAAGTTGSATSATSSLDRAQIEQLRTHLNELKRLLSQSGR